MHKSWGYSLPISVGQGIQLVQTILEIHPQSWSHDHSRYWRACHAMPQIISSNECHCIKIINYIKMNGFDRHGYKQTTVHCDEDGIDILTTGNFLIGRPLESLSDTLTTQTVTTLRRWSLCQPLTLHFWKRWSTDYFFSWQKLSKW